MSAPRARAPRPWPDDGRAALRPRTSAPRNRPHHVRRELWPDHPRAEAEGRSWRRLRRPGARRTCRGRGPRADAAFACHRRSLPRAPDPSAEARRGARRSREASPPASSIPSRAGEASTAFTSGSASRPAASPEKLCSSATRSNESPTLRPSVHRSLPRPEQLSPLPPQSSRLRRRDGHARTLAPPPIRHGRDRPSAVTPGAARVPATASGPAQRCDPWALGMRGEPLAAARGCAVAPPRAAGTVTA